MNVFNLLSLRGRFLVAPVIGVILTLILYFTSNAIIQSQADVFQQLSDSNLPQISQISQIIVKLSSSHNDLSALLSSTGDDQDEERIYLQGREILNDVHELEKLLILSIGSSEKVIVDQVNILEKISKAFTHYRETTISAIELSSVDASLVHQKSIETNKALLDLNNLFFILSEYHVANLTAQADLVEGTLYNQNIVSVLGIALLIIMIISALYFSKNLSSGIELINRALVKLSHGKIDIELPEETDQYLNQLTVATYEFKKTLEKNSEQKNNLNSTIEKLKDSEERYINLINLIATAIVIIDNQQNIVLFNKAAERIFGYSVRDVIGKPLEQLLPDACHYQHSIDVDSFKHLDIEHSVSMNRKPVKATRKNGEEFFIEANLSKLQLANETLMTAAITDVTERLKAEEKILHQAYFDTLTDLPNRFLSLDRLSNLIIDAKRKNELVAILFLDLDDFKKVNDTLGHETGDKLLIEAAARLLSVVRSGDTVGRLGGDEFIVLLSELYKVTDVLPIVDNLITQFRKAFEIDDRELILTASIGIAVFPDDGDNASELLRNADSAMYNAKELGRNAYSYFTEAMNKEVSRRLALEEQMHGALNRNEFQVFYQPQIEVDSNRIVGAEALLRWTNPVLGDVMPDEFITIAEQTGLIIPLGEFVLKQALEMTAQWQNLFNSRFLISVNLSPSQFRDPNLLDFIKNTLHQFNVLSEFLELEITEGVLMSGHTYIDEALIGMNNLGVSIALDDFGTGYSSLSYLRNYPFDTLKIDRSFVNDMTEKPADRELVNATIAMAHALRLKVVAEGVETEEQLAHLATQGCETAQGYLFSKPISSNEFSKMLERVNQI